MGSGVQIGKKLDILVT